MNHQDNLPSVFLVWIYFLCFLNTSSAFSCGTPSNNCYYVRAGAVGTGDGSDWTNSFTSLPAALQRSSVYYIASGTYSGYTFDDLGSGTITVKKPTTSSHGSNAGWNNAYADGQAIFNGAVIFSTGDYILDGSTGGGPVEGWNSGHGILLTASSNSNYFNIIKFVNNPSNIVVKHAGNDTTEYF